MSNICIPHYSSPPILPTDDSYLSAAMQSVLLVKFEGDEFYKIHFYPELLEHLIIHALHSNQRAKRYTLVLMTIFIDKYWGEVL